MDLLHIHASTKKKKKTEQTESVTIDRDTIIEIATVFTYDTRSQVKSMEKK